MKTKITTMSALFAITIGSMLQSCKKDAPLTPDPASGSTPALVEKSRENHGDRIFYGPTVHIGLGVMRAWVKENNEGDPTAVGINLSEKALVSLPAQDQSWVLYFPKNKGHNFYTHMLIDWNPHGHEPVPIYGLPHFDFHFYIIPNSERMAIGPYDSIQFANAPAPEFVPPFYLQTAGGVPQMGAHWVDLLSPEFNGGIFTKTFIWGSYDGNFIFWEPMITLAYLKSHPDDMVPLRQPAAFQRDGWYATDYRVKYTDRDEDGYENGGKKEKGYTVALMNLTYHSGEGEN